MKVLLLEHPRSITQERCNDIANAPLSASLMSGYVGGMLQSQGHKVEILDGYLDKLTYPQILDQVEQYKPDILGVHMVYHWQTDEALFTCLTQIKQAGYTSYIAVYGFYPTFAYERILETCKAIDMILIGEPEHTFTDLVTTLSQGPFWESIKGIAYRNTEGNIVASRRPLVEDLDSFPFPLRPKSSLSIGEVNVAGSRGCYGACTFCYINPFYGEGSKWRARSPENIVAEIDQIKHDYQMNYFYFTDPNFFGPGQRGQERALQLACLLKSRDIQFGLEARVNDIRHETIAPLVEAGLRHILIGLESGREEALQRLNKKTTVEQNEKALTILRSYGIEPNVGFIMFEPDSSVEDLRINFEFLKRNHLLDNLDITVNVLYHHQIILQGTESFRQLQAEGRLHITPYSAYEGHTPYQRLEVEAFAGCMRDITNHIFSCMQGIWSGRNQETKDAKERYHQVNSLLVQCFETLLEHLEKGFTLTVENNDIVAGTKQKIATILSFT